MTSTVHPPPWACTQCGAHNFPFVTECAMCPAILSTSPTPCLQLTPSPPPASPRQSTPHTISPRRVSSPRTPKRIRCWAESAIDRGILSRIEQDVCTEGHSITVSQLQRIRREDLKGRLSEEELDRMIEEATNSTSEGQDGLVTLDQLSAQLIPTGPGVPDMRRFVDEWRIILDALSWRHGRGRTWLLPGDIILPKLLDQIIDKLDRSHTGIIRFSDVEREVHLVGKMKRFTAAWEAMMNLEHIKGQHLTLKQFTWAVGGACRSYACHHRMTWLSLVEPIRGFVVQRPLQKPKITTVTPPISKSSPPVPISSPRSTTIPYTPSPNRRTRTNFNASCTTTSSGDSNCSSHGQSQSFTPPVSCSSSLSPRGVMSWPQSQTKSPALPRPPGKTSEGLRVAAQMYQEMPPSREDKQRRMILCRHQKKSSRDRPPTGLRTSQIDNVTCARVLWEAGDSAEFARHSQTPRVLEPYDRKHYAFYSPCDTFSQRGNDACKWLSIKTSHKVRASLHVSIDLFILCSSGERSQTGA